MAKKKRKGGRPRIEIDLVRVEQLASIGATQAEIAADMAVSVDTLQRRKGFAAAYKRGLERGKLSLRHKQFNMALGISEDVEPGKPAKRGKGDKGMLIWLGKQLLGQSDKQEIRADMIHRSTTELIEAARNGGFAPEEGT